MVTPVPGCHCAACDPIRGYSGADYHNMNPGETPVTTKKLVFAPPPDPPTTAQLAAVRTLVTDADFPLLVAVWELLSDGNSPPPETAARTRQMATFLTDLAPLLTPLCHFLARGLTEAAAGLPDAAMVDITALAEGHHARAAEVLKAAGWTEVITNGAGPCDFHGGPACTDNVTPPNDFYDKTLLLDAVKSLQALDLHTEAQSLTECPTSQEVIGLCLDSVAGARRAGKYDQVRVARLALARLLVTVVVTPAYGT